MPAFFIVLDSLNMVIYLLLCFCLPVAIKLHSKLHLFNFWQCEIWLRATTHHYEWLIAKVVYSGKIRIQILNENSEWWSVSLDVTGKDVSLKRMKGYIHGYSPPRAWHWLSVKLNKLHKEFLTESSATDCETFVFRWFSVTDGTYFY